MTGMAIFNLGMIVGGALVIIGLLLARLASTVLDWIDERLGQK